MAQYLAFLGISAQDKIFLAAAPLNVPKRGGLPGKGPVGRVDGLGADDPAGNIAVFAPESMYQARHIGRIHPGDPHAAGQGEIAPCFGQPGIGRRCRGHRRVDAAQTGDPFAQDDILVRSGLCQQIAAPLGLPAQDVGYFQVDETDAHQDAQAQQAENQKKIALVPGKTLQRVNGNCHALCS